jgi:hypothetical protein
MVQQIKSNEILTMDQLNLNAEQKTGLTAREAKKDLL